MVYTDRAARDLREVVSRLAVWSSLARADVRSKYRLSTFGSLWITLTTAALALAIGLFYGQFFGQDMRAYLPYFTVNYVAWNFMASVFGEASVTLVNAGNLIKSSQMPIAFHILRMLHRNFIIFLHNAIVVILIWLYLRWPLHPSALLSLGGIILLYLFLVGISGIIAIVCVRYHDVPPLIQVLIQFLFFLTPIIWYPEQIKFGAKILELNPVTYMLVVIRDPILGRATEPQTWIIAIILSAASVLAGSIMYLRFRRRIAYWV